MSLLKLWERHRDRRDNKQRESGTRETKRSYKEDGPGEEEDSTGKDTSKTQATKRSRRTLLGKAPEGGREAMLLGGFGGDHPQKSKHIKQNIKTLKYKNTIKH
ncbi:hypothetical protein NPIL_21481 [Nephila pilipes]|uniref:Uncharacterized protein n=1 Tax=Nephila pilipes TaxID=299642 RepID=A0A8X6UAI5_NEPPI|nr:hypothetical protein NPIL_21481 [Nephila pilipes]